MTDTFVERVTEFLKLFKKQNCSSTPLTTDEGKDLWALEKYFKKHSSQAGEARFSSSFS